MSRKMKDSGVEWIGKIPEDWNQVSLMRVLRERITDGPHETPNYTSDGIPFISVDSLGKGEQVDLSVVRKYISESDYEIYNQKTKLTNGDILFTKSATIGKTAIVDTNIKYMVWSPIAVIKADKDNVYNRYLYHILNSHKFINHAILLGTSNTQVNVGMRTLEKSRIPLPPTTDEQQVIANFLDQKVSEIDHIIEKTKLSIEEYKNYKQSLITETVTKGLNPDIKMKDSGIEWIGKIPEHWNLVKLTNITNSYSGGTPSRSVKSYWENGNIPWMSSGEVNKCLVYDTNEKISDEGFNNSSAKYFPINTVVVALNGQGKTKGMSAILKIETTVNQSLVGFICDKEKLYYSYLNYCFISSYFYNRSFLAGGNKREGISAGDLKQSRIPLPKVQEQQLIVNHLDFKCNKIDILISQKEQLLTEHESYKKSLIFECVTGKREVM